MLQKGIFRRINIKKKVLSSSPRLLPLHYNPDGAGHGHKLTSATRKWLDSTYQYLGMTDLNATLTFTRPYCRKAISTPHVLHMVPVPKTLDGSIAFSGLLVYFPLCLSLSGSSPRQDKTRPLFTPTRLHIVGEEAYHDNSAVDSWVD